MYNNEDFDFGFDTEFMSDDEIEQMLDSAVTALADDISEDNKRTSVVNMHRIGQVSCVYNVMKYMTKGRKNIKVSYELYSPYKSMGCVSVVGKKINFTKPEWFMKAVELSNNLDVYPKTDGSVQIDFTFHGLTIPIE